MTWLCATTIPKPDLSRSHSQYLAPLGLNEGWLLVFDRRKNALPIEERLSTQVIVTQNQRSITVIRA